MTPDITSVTYSRLRSFGNYENATVTATAVVKEGEDAQVVLDGLRDWVHERLTEQAGVGEIKESIAELRYQADQQERRLETARARWNALMTFLEKIGVNRPEDLPDDLAGLPF